MIPGFDGRSSSPIRGLSELHRTRKQVRPIVSPFRFIIRHHIYIYIYVYFSLSPSLCTELSIYLPVYLSVYLRRTKSPVPEGPERLNPVAQGTS